MTTEWTDPEFLSWSPDAQYIFQERLGMLCGDTPFDQCDPKAVEMARAQAREATKFYDNDR